MARFNPKNIIDDNQKSLLKSFWQTVTLIENYDESQIFLRDLLHPQEVVMFARRIHIAKMLREGFSFEEIGLILQTAPNTIAKVNKALDYGRGGLASMIDKLLKHEKEQLKTDLAKWDPYSWTNIKRRYAIYFWPIDMLERLEEKWQELQRHRSKKSSIPA